MRLTEDLDATTLSLSLDEVFARTDYETFADDWLILALLRLGQAWHRGEVSVAGEHFVSAGVHRRLLAAADAAAPTTPAPPGRSSAWPAAPCTSSVSWPSRSRWPAPASTWSTSAATCHPTAGSSRRRRSGQRPW